MLLLSQWFCDPGLGLALDLFVHFYPIRGRLSAQDKENLLQVHRVSGWTTESVDSHVSHITCWQ